MKNALAIGLCCILCLMNHHAVNNALAMLELNFVWMPVNGLLVSVHCVLIHHHGYMCVMALVYLGHGHGWMGA